MSDTLYLAHINDTHSHFDPSPVNLSFDIDQQSKPYTIDCGGYAQIASAVAGHRENAAEQHCPHLLLHAGDSFQGSLYFSCYKGRANSRLLNMLRPDAMTIGNHEFDLGNDPLQEFIAEADFPLLAGNMDLSQENQGKSHPMRPLENLYSYNSEKGIAQYLLKSMGEAPLAIFGITLDSMPSIGSPDPDCLFVDAIETTRTTVKHLKQQGIHRIIVLSHLGYAGDVALAEAVPGISLIVGGHTHSISGDFAGLNVAKAENINHRPNGSLILHAGQHAESIGLFQLRFDQDGQVQQLEGGVKFLVDSDNLGVPATISGVERSQLKQAIVDHPQLLRVPRQAAMETLIAREYRPAIEAMHSQQIAELPWPLIHSRLPNEQFPAGSEIAPLVCKAFYLAAQTQGEIDFALHNAGGVRVSLKAGPLTLAEVHGRLLPFQIPIVAYSIKGKDLRQALEGALNNAFNNGVIGSGDGSYPYCYRLRFHYEPDNVAGERVLRLQLYRDGTWQAVCDNSQYRGVSSAYTLAGKEGYSMLTRSGQHHELGYTMSDAFAEFAFEIFGNQSATA